MTDIFDMELEEEEDLDNYSKENDIKKKVGNNNKHVGFILPINNNNSGNKDKTYSIKMGNKSNIITSNNLTSHHRKKGDQYVDDNNDQHNLRDKKSPRILDESSPGRSNNHNNKDIGRKETTTEILGFDFEVNFESSKTSSSSFKENDNNPQNQQQH